MLKTLKARCVNGALALLEPVELRKVHEYLLNLDVHPAPGRETGAVCYPPARGRMKTSIGKQQSGCFTKLAAPAPEFRTESRAHR